MDYRGDQRPPRSTRPHSQSRSPAPAYPDPAHPSRPPLVQHDGTRGNVSFQNTERGDRQGQLDSNRQHTMPYAYQSNITHNEDLEGADYYNAARVGRQKSLVRPEREKIEPGHRQWHYRNHVAQLEEENHGRLGVIPSTTGNIPQRDTGVRRGRSLLARDQDIHESGLALFKRGATLRRKREQVPSTPTAATAVDFTKQNKRGCYNGAGPGGPWMTYCTILTACFPPFLLNSCGLRSPERQRAWREKIGLISLILLLMAGVGFLTFGFTQVVCGKPPNRFHGGAIGNANIGQSSVVIHGYDYDFSKFFHPKVGMFNGTTNPLYDPGWNLGGNDASFMFQKVNQQCLGIITKAPNSTITGTGQNLDWYFPCNIYSQYGSTGANNTNYETSTSCHIASGTRQLFASTMHPQGQVYYTWDDVYNTNRNLAVFESTVLDLNLLQWLSRAQVNYPVLFDEMKTANGTYNGKDITMQLIRGNQRNIGHCLEDIISIGSVDTNSIGCVASEVVLYLSLVFIIGVVAIRFVMALLFQWFFSWKLGNFPRETYQQRMQRSAEIENWSNDIYRPAPSEYRPNVSKNGLHGKGAKATKGKPFIPKQSRFTQRPTTTYGPIQDLSPNWKRGTMYSTSVKTGAKGNLQDSSKSTMSLGESQCPFPLHNVVPQPPPDYEPFNFPLAHSICLVTAYSESVEGLRTTLDSLATTDYPNSHKLIMVIADGMVKGAGNALTTPEICLQMMKEFIISPDEVEPHSYMAIADGHRRHNMAKVYAGFYDYDNATVERSKQQRVPMVLVAKVGNPLEEGEAKPGNRGKRDSQIMLMGFLQRVMFDERMTTFEYEFFNSIWRVTGVSPDRYELVLCVDADTKVFPDSMTRMVSCMVHDEEIMGLCGETKVANKADSFVTMMQVFEYYISHHMTKAFESMFGGVTCLPGCFSMYRIKARKGDEGYWVPILANPDVVEHYSENVVDTLHKKNLLLLGEDRYLTTLMLKTFPKRKNMFCPQAVCKTVVPDTFRVLLSQRRRWINSTIHNLAELLLVRDLCGTFCFSMQFVVGMELAGTLVLPAAIAFTLYLIIESIIPGGPNTTISLVLLAIVLGLPGLLIVVTSRKIAYIGWMLVYLISLPIWNGVLPAYAFWHFDDFSWGQTRKVLGDKGAHSGDKVGEFDSSRIIMKRWAEFERDRRWRSGTQSRDSTYYEKKSDSNRLSMTSNSDTHHPPSGAFDSSTLETSYNTPRSRHDSNALLMLPAPLAANRPMMASTSTVGGPRSSEDNFVSDSASGSNLRLVPSPQSIDHDSYESHHANQRLLSPQYDFPTSPRMPAPANTRQPTSPQYYDGNMYRQLTTSPSAYDENPQVWSPVDYSPEDSRVRGISLTDSGPVPGPEGVRRVSRPTGRRPPSQAPAQNVNRYSRSSAVYSLPPGAAPPSNYYSST